MFRFHWLSSLKDKLRAPISRNSRTYRKQNCRVQAPFVQASVSRFVTESLEDRTLLTAFTVVNTNDSGTGSLREAIELANANAGADTISFDASLAGQSIVLTDELKISDDLTINGLGSDKLTLDGNGNSRIFNIDDSNNETIIIVEIHGLTLTNGSAEQGGAIYSSDSLSLIEITLSMNTATQFYGAGVYNNGGNLFVDRSYFHRNITEGYKNIGYGGGIYQLGGSLTVTNSGFSGNESSYTGGGIYASSASHVSVSNTSFNLNYARLGGALGIDSSPLTIRNSFFSANRATEIHGGAIDYKSKSKSALIEDCQFTDNYAKGVGGAVYSYFGYLTVVTSTFTNNMAEFNGGAIATYDDGVIQGCTFIRNRSDLNGGAIGSSGNLRVSGSTFAENSARFDGGAIHQGAESLWIINSTLTHNTCKSHGGAINVMLIYGTTFHAINCTIVSNSAYYPGGGINVLLIDGNFFLINSIVAGNASMYSTQVSGSYTGASNIIRGSISGLIDPVLRDNGGPTQTYALLTGSDAINAGSNVSYLANDQRGTGFVRIIDGTIDIGAFEFQGPYTQIDLRIVNSKTSTQGNGESSSLPDNLAWIDEWSDYWLEIWISTPTRTDLGILSTALNLSYNTAITTATNIEYGSAFTLNQTGTINDVTGTIENLSAATSLTDVGDDQHVLFARIRFESTSDDAVDLDLEGQSLNPQSPDFLISQPEIIFVGGPPSEEVHGSSPNTKIYANPYDLNDDDAINFKDLMLFASVYNTIPSESNSDYSWFADLNQSDRVNFKDLILFASNYGKRKSNQSMIVYPQNFPEAWNNLLIADTSQAEPQTSPVSLSQSAADSVLDGVVEYVSPQLTPSQNETLENIDIQVIDLEGDTLGRAVTGTIYIDVNAAGYGWFIDDTPGDHSEFEQSSHLSLIALPDSDAAGRVDLWSVIMHELGHLLGYEHEDEGVMEETLAAGIRKLPHFADEHALQSDSETDEFFTSLKESSNLIAF